MTKSPATLVEAEALDYARKLIAAFFKENKWEYLGMGINPFEGAETRRLVVDCLKGLALIDTKNMNVIVDWARQGWGLAQDAAVQLSAEFENRRIEKPAVLAAFLVDHLEGRIRAPRKRGPKKVDKFLRDIAIVVIVGKVAQKFALNPTRNQASEGPSACSIVARALAIKTLHETGVVKIWEKYEASFFAL